MVHIGGRSDGRRVVHKYIGGKGSGTRVVQLAVQQQ